MITVKAIKEQESQVRATTPESFAAREPDERRRMPLAFLLFLAACVAYLKSFLPMGAEAREANAADEPERNAKGDGAAAQDEAPATAETEAATTPEAADAAPDAPRPTARIAPPREAGEAATDEAAHIDARTPPPAPTAPIEPPDIAQANRVSGESRASAQEEREGGGGGGGGGDAPMRGGVSKSARGGDGDDHMMAAADEATNHYDGAAGEDTLDFSVATHRVLVDLGHGVAQGEDIGTDLFANFERIVGGSGDDLLIAGPGAATLSGRGGADTFVFLRADDDRDPDVVRKITDFSVGDRIIAARFDIHHRADGDAAHGDAEPFDRFYLSAPDDNRPVRFRFEQQGPESVTVVEVYDVPGDEQQHFAIQVAGHHHLQFAPLEA